MNDRDILENETLSNGWSSGFRRGQESAIKLAISLCLDERVDVAGPSDEAYNLAIEHCVRALEAVK